MIKLAQKIRLYPTDEQQVQLSKAFGCCRWWYNFALNLCTEEYQQNGKHPTRTKLNSLLPKLKKEHEWLKKDVYSSGSPTSYT